jgi:hypothetical protein
MLITKGIAEGEVVTIKTTAGEEIIAKLVQDDEKSVTVSKPLALTAGAKGIALVPFLFTTDPDTQITISKQTVMVVAPTDKEYADTYIQNTTGIKLV